MKNFLCGVIILIYTLSGFANKNHCSSEVDGYKVVLNSVYPFTVDKEKACFFAFYTTNPDPTLDIKGNGNTGSAIWYGYYLVDSLNEIYEFPKPLDMDWTNVCSLDAVSFYDMNGDKKPDVTIIGSCNKSAIHYTVSFVFSWTGKKYVLNEDVYRTLFGFLSLTVADVRAYIQSPKAYLEVLKRDNAL